MHQVYFSCSITGGRQDQPVYDMLTRAMLEAGYQVPTAHLASADILDLEAVVEPHDVFERDVAWVRGSQAVVAEVSTPSHGVGYEIALALQQGIPVLCCYRAGGRVSKMITGNDDPNLSVMSYQSGTELVQGVLSFLQRLPSTCE